MGGSESKSMAFFHESANHSGCFLPFFVACQCEKEALGLSSQLSSQLSSALGFSSEVGLYVSFEQTKFTFTLDATVLLRIPEVCFLFRTAELFRLFGNIIHIRISFFPTNPMFCTPTKVGSKFGQTSILGTLTAFLRAQIASVGLSDRFIVLPQPQETLHVL